MNKICFYYHAFFCTKHDFGYLIRSYGEEKPSNIIPNLSWKICCNEDYHECHEYHGIYPYLNNINYENRNWKPEKFLENVYEEHGTQIKAFEKD